MARAYRIDDIHVFILKSNPVQLAITAVGAVSSSGWKDGRLSPWVYIVPPADGIQDFDFEGTPPSGISLPVISPFTGHGIFPDPPAWLKGIRIHATSNQREYLIAAGQAVAFADDGEALVALAAGHDVGNA